jgi:hypothetical protein
MANVDDDIPVDVLATATFDDKSEKDIGYFGLYSCLHRSYGQSLSISLRTNIQSLYVSLSFGHLSKDVAPASFDGAERTG